MTAISQSEFLQALGWAVLNSLWQMALLWVIYQIVTAGFGLSKPSRKTALATSLLFTGFAWFVISFFLLLSSGAHSSGYTGWLDMERSEQLSQWLNATLPVASLLYLALLSLPVINFIRNYRYVQVIRRQGLVKADVQWRMFVQKVGARMGIHKPVQVWMSEFVSSPVTVGYIKPMILLPVAAVNHLSSEQVEAVLLHELSHIRRYDYLLNLITRFVQTILYFNPFVKAFARIIEREREKSCDELVMQFQYEPKGYATALLTLETASRSRTPLAVAANGGKKNELLGRIESILGIEKKPVFSFSKLAGVMAALLCFIGLNAVLILSKPGATVAGDGFLSQLSTPFVFMTESAGNFPIVKTDNDSPTIVNLPSKAVAAEAAASTTQNGRPAEPQTIAIDARAEAHQELPSYAAHPDAYMFVSHRELDKPILSREEEAQVKAAMDASKKVMEETQWKTVETSIAEALTLAEKERVRAEYRKSFEEQKDWEKAAENLRLAYDQIDWKTVNTELNAAMARISLDSIQYSYNLALNSLVNLKKEMTTNGQVCIPDSDITLKALENKITEIQRASNKLKAQRVLKVIRL